MADAETDHSERRDRYRSEAAGLDARAGRVSLARLLLFLGAVVLLGSGFSQGSSGLIAAGAACVATFVAAVVMHLRLIGRREAAERRAQVQERHLLRLAGRASELPSDGRELLQPNHPFAGDVDLVGPGSLFQRLDVSHTVRGAETLASWLSTPSDADTIRKRQAAIEELARRLDLREDLEVAAGDTGKGKLDAEPFLNFTRQPSFFGSARWLVWRSTCCRR